MSPEADCQEPGSAPEPYARQSSIGYVYLYLFTNAMLLASTVTSTGLDAGNSHIGITP